MHYIVLDLEWNQALSRDLVRTKEFVLTGEVIEIGAVKLDAECRPVAGFRQIVTPKIYRKMHWSVRKLTGISNKSLESGLPFPEAFSKFLAWCGDDFAFLTWGPDDLPMLETNLRLHKMPTPDSFRSFDLQRIYSRTISMEKRQCALSDALARLEIEDVYPPHDALNDALNTSMICRYVDLEDAIAHYEEPIQLTEEEPEEPVGEVKEYTSLEEMFREAAEKSVVCEACGETLPFGKWVRRSPGKRIALAECACGKTYIAGIRWHVHAEDESVTAIHTVREATDAQKRAYERLQHRRRRSRRRGASADAGSDTPAAEIPEATETEELLTDTEE